MFLIFGCISFHHVETKFLIYMEIRMRVRREEICLISCGSSQNRTFSFPHRDKLLRLTTNFKFFLYSIHANTAIYATKKQIYNKRETKAETKIQKKKTLHIKLIIQKHCFSYKVDSFYNYANSNWQLEQYTEWEWGAGQEVAHLRSWGKRGSSGKIEHSTSIHTP